MKLSTKIKNTLTTKVPFMKKTVQGMADAKNHRRYLKAAVDPVDDKLILFMSFMGKKYADSPRAIYEYMLSSDEYRDYKFVWAFVHPDRYPQVAANPQTKVVKLNSDEHYKIYATSKYWVTNSRVPDVIDKREEQVYLQCWHGTPLKRLGLDIEVKGANARHSASDMGEKYRIDARKYTYMVSPSPYCTEKFTSAFGLDEVGREDIIVETGYPRNDELAEVYDSQIESLKDKLGIPQDKKVILYAPTWRDNQYDATVGYTYKEEVDFTRLRESLGDDFIILFRAHYFVSNAFDFEKYKGFVYNVSDYDEINDLYIVSDVLMTDYSSVFFDYANLRRPIIFFMYDLKEYRDTIRGFYISLDELPGPVIETEDELIEELRALDGWQPDDKYKAFNKKFNPLDDGSASERVVKRCIG